MTARQSSATDKALRDVARGMSGYAAAKKHGLALSTIYRAIARQKNPRSLPSATPTASAAILTRG